MTVHQVTGGRGAAKGHHNSFRFWTFGATPLSVPGSRIPTSIIVNLKIKHVWYLYNVNSYPTIFNGKNIHLFWWFLNMFILRWPDLRRIKKSLKYINHFYNYEFLHFFKHYYGPPPPFGIFLVALVFWAYGSICFSFHLWFTFFIHQVCHLNFGLAARSKMLSIRIFRLKIFSSWYFS